MGASTNYKGLVGLAKGTVVFVGLIALLLVLVNLHTPVDGFLVFNITTNLSNHSTGTAQQSPGQPIRTNHTIYLEPGSTVDFTLALNLTAGENITGYRTNNLTNLTVRLPFNFTFVTNSNVTANGTNKTFFLTNVTNSSWIGGQLVNSTNITWFNGTFGFLFPNSSGGGPAFDSRESFGNFSWTFVVPNISNNTQVNMTVFLFNQTGHSNFTTINFTIRDTLIPMQTLNLTNDTVVNRTQGVKINVTVRDNTTYQVFAANGTNVSMSRVADGSDVFQVNSTPDALGCNINDGTCVIKLYANDSANNQNGTATISLTIDGTAPTTSLAFRPSATGNTLTSREQGSAIYIDCTTGDNNTITSTSLTVQRPGSGGTETVGCDSLYTNTNLAGTYTATLSATDEAGNSGQVVTTFTMTAATSSGGGTSGGGGGGGAGAVASSSSGLFSTLEADKPTRLELTKADETNVLAVSLTVTEAASSVQFKAEKLSSKPSTVSDLESTETVFAYLGLTVTGLEASKLKEAQVEFKVTKEWLTANSFEKTDIKLKRFANDAWNDLPTEVKSEDDTSVTFTATTPGFSTFAIVAEKAPAAETPPAEEKPTEQPKETTPPAEEKPTTPAQPINPLLIGGIVVVIIIIALAVYFFALKK